MTEKINPKMLGLIIFSVILALVFFYLAIESLDQNATLFVVYLAIAWAFLAFVAIAEYDMIKMWLGIM